MNARPDVRYVTNTPTMSMDHTGASDANGPIGTVGPSGVAVGRPTMRTTSWASRPMRDDTILGAGRLDQVRLVVDERLAESERARMGARAGRGLRDRIGGVLVAFGTAVAGRPARVPTRRPIAHVGDGR